MSDRVEHKPYPRASGGIGGGELHDHGRCIVHLCGTYTEISHIYHLILALILAPIPRGAAYGYGA